MIRRSSSVFGVVSLAFSGGHFSLVEQIYSLYIIRDLKMHIASIARIAIAISQKAFCLEYLVSRRSPL